MSDEIEENGPATDEDLAQARKRWADPQHEPAVKELFSAPVYGDGFRGDVPIGQSARESKDANGQEHADDGKFGSGGGGKKKVEAPHEVQAHELLTDPKPSKLKAAAKALYDRLPKPLQKAVDVGAAVEHHLESYYKAGQDLARAVAKERGLSDKHVERVGRILGIADGIARWTTNIPAAHQGLEVGAHAAAHALSHAAEVALEAVGGPVLFLAAKVGYYVPVASLAYVGYSMAREAFSGKNPIATIKRARERIKAQKGAEHHG